MTIAPSNYAVARAAAASAKPAAKAAASKLTASELAKRAADKEAARRSAIALLAPADEYFGPLKLSLIGMRNSIRDIGLRYDVNHDIAKQSYASTQLVERSVRDWEKKYAKDPQLPRVIFILQRLYTKVLLKESRDRASVIASWLRTDFTRSPQEKQLAKTLAVEHLAALPAPTPEPTPMPTGYQSIFGSSYPSEFAPAAAASSAPAPSTSPIPKS